MEKVAIIVYGEYREFDVVSKCFKNIFLNDDNVQYDIYLSTWDKSYLVFEDRYEIITKEHILEIMPNANISVKSEEEYMHLIDSNTIETVAKIPSLTGTITAFKSIIHWKIAMDMIKKSNINYNKIILTRTDNMFFGPIKNSPLEHTVIFENNVIYALVEMQTTSYSPCGYCVQDVFFAGNYDIMSKFIDIVDLNIPITCSLHEHLACCFINNNIVIKDINEIKDITQRICVIIIRPTFRNLNIEIDNYSYNPENIIPSIIRNDNENYCKNFFGYTINI